MRFISAVPWIVVVAMAFLVAVQLMPAPPKFRAWASLAALSVLVVLAVAMLLVG